MKDKEIAAEAAEEIREAYNLAGVATILPIIKSAIEKATEDVEHAAHKAGYSAGLADAIKFRAAHASELHTRRVFKEDRNQMEAAAHTNDKVKELERIAFERISKALASTWDEIFHAAESRTECAGKIPETLSCPSCGARDHDLEIKVGLLKARTSEQGADTELVREIGDESAMDYYASKYVVIQMTISTWDKLQKRYAALSQRPKKFSSKQQNERTK